MDFVNAAGKKMKPDNSHSFVAEVDVTPPMIVMRSPFNGNVNSGLFGSGTISLQFHKPMRTDCGTIELWTYPTSISSDTPQLNAADIYPEFGYSIVWFNDDKSCTITYYGIPITATNSAENPTNAGRHEYRVIGFKDKAGNGFTPPAFPGNMYFFTQGVFYTATPTIDSVTTLSGSLTGVAPYGSIIINTDAAFITDPAVLLDGAGLTTVYRGGAWYADYSGLEYGRTYTLTVQNFRSGNSATQYPSIEPKYYELTVRSSEQADLTPLEVLSVTLQGASSSTSVQPYGNLAITFDDVIGAAGKVILRNESDTTLADIELTGGEISGNVYTVFYRDLMLGNTYQVIIEGFKNSAGLPMTAYDDYRFTVVSTFDSAITLNSSSPPFNANNSIADGSRKITLTFNRMMNTDKGQLTLYNLTEARYVGTTNLDGSPNEKYAIVLDEGITWTYNASTGTHTYTIDFDWPMYKNADGTGSLIYGGVTVVDRDGNTISLAGIYSGVQYLLVISEPFEDLYGNEFASSDFTNILTWSNAGHVPGYSDYHPMGTATDTGRVFRLPFEYDRAAPQVIGVEVLDRNELSASVTDAPTRGFIKVTFDKTMSTIGVVTSIRLRDISGVHPDVVLGFSRLYNGNGMNNDTFLYAYSRLYYDTEYEIIIDGFKSIATPLSGTGIATVGYFMEAPYYGYLKITNTVSYPQVIVSAPGKDAKNIPLSGEIRITFGSNMDTSIAGSISLNRGIGVLGGGRWAGNTYVVAYTGLLQASVYTVSVTGFVDEDRSTMMPYEFGFTTLRTSYDAGDITEPDDNGSADDIDDDDPDDPDDSDDTTGGGTGGGGTSGGNSQTQGGSSTSSGSTSNGLTGTGQPISGMVVEATTPNSPDATQQSQPEAKSDSEKPLANPVSLVPVVPLGLGFQNLANTILTIFVGLAALIVIFLGGFFFYRRYRKRVDEQ
jgi:hypothetical protein